MLDLKPKKFTLLYKNQPVAKTDWDSLWKHLLTEFGDMPILKITKNMEIIYDRK
jgi:hypothetical protein